MNFDLIKINNLLGDTIESTEPISGGSICEVHRLHSKTNTYLLKSHPNARVIQCEANSLAELKKQNAITIPKIYAQEDNYLIMEYIPHGKNLNFFEFGKALAQLHKISSLQYGFKEDNYIGASEQINTFEENWSDFYWLHRLKPQLQWANLTEYSPLLESKVYELLGHNTTPSLLHGDLWSGNFLCNKANEAVLIDPATYYGCRETDLAMTKLFGGFPKEFYEGYQIQWPLEDKWQNREGLYQLYHVLNHVNLFGNSYMPQALLIINNYQS